MMPRQLAIEAVADATEVYPGLWMGSAPPIGGSVAHNKFDCLVLSAAEYQPHPSCFKDVRVHLVPLNDDGETPMQDVERVGAVEAAQLVHKWMGSGKTTLVTCHMGLNRSGLVCAIALCYAGVEWQDAITMVRAARGPWALSNTDFTAFIETLFNG